MVDVLGTAFSGTSANSAQVTTFPPMASLGQLPQHAGRTMHGSRCATPLLPAPSAARVPARMHVRAGATPSARPQVCSFVFPRYFSPLRHARP